jgi:4'-phosphopantetheinyl transferase
VEVVLEGGEQERPLLFLRAWTRKEAVLKALGMGFRIPLRSFAVPAQPSGCWTVTQHEPADQWESPITVRDISRGEVIAALAGEDVGGPLVEREFRPE